MKKIFITLLFFIFLLPLNIKAIENNKNEVTLSKCVDSESARFILGVNEIKVKFIGIQLEEKIITDEEDEINGSFVSDYVCNSLKNAKKIIIELEPNIISEDKFGRIQAWVFIDDILLQEDLVKNGYASVMYLSEDYLYANKLIEAQNYAKENKIGLWTENSKNSKIENKKIIQTNEKSRNIFEIIADFFVSIFNKICEIIDSIINNIL